MGIIADILDFKFTVTEVGLHTYNLHIIRILVLVNHYDTLLSKIMLVITFIPEVYFKVNFCQK